MSADKSKLVLVTIDSDGKEIPFGGGAPFAVGMPKKATVVCVTLDATGKEVPVAFTPPDGGSICTMSEAGELMINGVGSGLFATQDPTFTIDETGHLIKTVGEVETDLGLVVGTDGEDAAPSTFEIDENGHLIVTDANEEVSVDLGLVVGANGVTPTIAIGTVTEGLAWGFSFSGVAPDYVLDITTPPAT